MTTARAAHGECQLELVGLHKRYGDFHAVRGVSLRVPSGTVFGLLGPNGAGKTSTIRMIMDITAPDEGAIHLFGRPRRKEDLRRIGYLPEERGLYRKMTVVEHLLFLAELHGMKRSAALPKIRQWLDRLELADWAKRKVEELSKGMQQKIQLVSTVLHDPEIIILDEPFSGLDPINQTLFREAFADFKRQGKTLLFSTHVMEHAERLCDSICLISHGRTVLEGELQGLKRDFGGNAYRVTGDGDLSGLGALRGVESVSGEPGDGTARILIGRDTPGADVLRQAVLAGLPIREFGSEEPTLEDIFIHAVRKAEAEERETDRAR